MKRLVHRLIWWSKIRGREGLEGLNTLCLYVSRCSHGVLLSVKIFPSVYEVEKEEIVVLWEKHWWTTWPSLFTKNLVEVDSVPCDATNFGSCKLRITILWDRQRLFTEQVAGEGVTEVKAKSCPVVPLMERLTNGGSSVHWAASWQVSFTSRFCFVKSPLSRCGGGKGSFDIGPLDVYNSNISVII